jgi:hypothetical protein
MVKCLTATTLTMLWAQEQQCAGHGTMHGSLLRGSIIMSKPPKEKKPELGRPFETPHSTIVIAETHL